MNIFEILTIAFTAVLVISMIIDLRRFRNGFYLLGAILNGMLWFFYAAMENGIRPVYIGLIAACLFALMMAVPLFLIANGITMLRREGRSLANVLSLLFGLFIGAGEISLIYAIFTREGQDPAMKYYVMAAMTVIYVSVTFLAFLFYSLLVQILPRRTDFDYIIVHGAGLIRGDKISHLLEERLEKAIAVYRKDMSPPKMICSGGQGRDETTSEAAAMANYMRCHGVDPQDIILEDQSTDTMENIINSRRIIRGRGGRQYTALVTSNYHVFRALTYAKKLRFPCTGIGSHVASYYWPSAMIREFIAVMKDHLILFLSGIALIVFICLQTLA